MTTPFRSMVLSAALAGSLSILPAALAADWPHFRGPRGNGTAPDANPPLTWSETNHVAWKVSPTGRGRSSPVVFAGHIFLTTAVEQGVVRKRIGSDDMQTAEHVSLRALCLDRKTGKTLWETNLFDVPNPEPVHWLNSWATPTPVAEPGRVYCEFGTWGTACLDADTGKVLWQRQIKSDHQVGPGSSPVVEGNHLFLVRDGREAQYVTALDKNTGKTIWKTDRPPIKASSGNLKKSFSTPLLVEHDGQVQLVSPGAHWTAAYEPGTGREIWRVRHGEGFSIGTAPVAGLGLVYFGTGCFKAQLWAVRTNGTNDVTATHTAWKSLRQVPIMSSPLLVGEDLYWVADDGMATCADARTGDIQWQERLGGATLASPISVRDRVYFFRQDARAIVVKAGRKFERLAENTLTGTLVATPAVADRAFFLRTDTHLYCLQD